MYILQQKPSQNKHRNLELPKADKIVADGKINILLDDSDRHRLTFNCGKSRRNYEVYPALPTYFVIPYRFFVCTNRIENQKSVMGSGACGGQY